mgnify:CR=1 FL=1|jgi:hypothetical protein
MSNLGTAHILVGELAKDYSKLSTEEKNKLARTLFGISDKASSESTPKPTLPTSDLSSITEITSGDAVATVKPVAVTEPTVVVGETKEITISAVKVSTFYSDKAMKLPEGIVANAVEVNKENGTVKLKDIGRVVPANTGVILTGESGTYTLTSTTEAAKEFGKNDLKGSLTDIPASEVSTSSDVYYALAVNKGTPCFGIVETDIPAGKAYFTVPKSDSTDSRFPNGFTISNQD